MIVSKARSSLRAWLAMTLVGSFLFSFAAASDFDPKGFGAQALGAEAASSYTVLTVTTLQDTGNEGSFRWAVTRTYPRKVVFAVSGTIHLTSTLDIKTTSNSNRNYLTIDGMSAPDKGICIAGWEVILRDLDQVVINDVRFRRGRDQLPTFPQYDTTNSTGLDCVSIKGSKNILFDHVSFSWSCDELVGITRSQNITFQWCIFAEPLGQEQKWVLHPYGVDHSAGINISSSTVSVHHSLLYNFRFRGPQFEANDVNSGMATADRAVKLESVNNVVFNYRESGGRYSSAIESGTPNDATFHFHFVGNRYFPADNESSAREIVAASSSSPDTSGNLKIYVSGNIGPNRTSSSDPESDIVFAKSGSSLVNIMSAGSAYSGQLSSSPLFTHPSGQEIPAYTADDDLVDLVLANAGCRPETRDDADIRVVSLVQDRDASSPQISDPDEVGGYPDLSDSSNPWNNSDIGSVGVAGSASFSSGTHTVSGSGDLKGGEDRFHFVYQEVTGNCEIIARVVSISNVDDDAAAGVMIRDNLNDNCRMAAMLITSGNGAKARRRTTTGGNTIDTTVSVSAPEWVKVKRTGETFKYYRGGDGVNWTLEKTVTIEGFGSSTHVGLAVTSDNNTLLATGVFTDVSLVQ